MKCTIPEIAWHNKDPVLSIDIQPSKNDYYRLASGGTDCQILIWYLRITSNDLVDLEVVADLTRHQRAVNVVRWSPTGTYLSSGDDDGHIIIWKLKTDNVPLLEENSDKEQWIVHKVLRGHKEDVYDICWSPNESKLVSGSIDNTAIIWDFKKGKMDNILTDHKGFVQGVTWDPKGEYIATLSSDRTCRIFDNSGKQVIKRIKKGTLPVPADNQLYDKEVKYFHDDTFKSYYRRLSFSPDGNFLITPSGCVETDESKKALYCAYIFSLHESKQPAAVLPTLKQNTVAVRCCPILFELREEGPEPLIPLPYRMIIAVATDSDVILYDTQQHAPFAHLQKIHYTRLTDLTWSPDGLILACSSTDGFCTFVTFAVNELGVQYNLVQIEEENITDVADGNISNVNEDKVTTNEITASCSQKQAEVEVKPKMLTLLQQWAIKSPKDSTLTAVNSKKKLINDRAKNLKIIETLDIVDSPEKISNNEDLENRQQSTPKRIFPIKIGECRNKTLESNKDAEGNEKLIGTPKSSKKRNSILNFLKSENVTPTKKKKIERKLDARSIPMECNTEEARDAWNSTQVKVVDPIEILEEDSEFKLELTISDNEQSNDCLKTEIKANDGTKDSDINNVPKSSSVDDNTKINIIKEVPTSSKSNKQNSSNDNSECTGTKPKRRVPLITLSNVKESGNAEMINGNLTKINDSIQDESVIKQENKSIINKIKDNDTAIVDKKIANDGHDGKRNEEKPRGRRVPLITLSSPKTRSKKVT